MLKDVQKVVYLTERSRMKWICNTVKRACKIVIICPTRHFICGCLKLLLPLSHSNYLCAWYFSQDTAVAAAVYAHTCTLVHMHTSMHSSSISREPTP